jgi:hypothetical protein
VNPSCLQKMQKRHVSRDDRHVHRDAVSVAQHSKSYIKKDMFLLYLYVISHKTLRHRIGVLESDLRVGV